MFQWKKSSFVPKEAEHQTKVQKWQRAALTMSGIVFLVASITFEMIKRLFQPILDPVECDYPHKRSTLLSWFAFVTFITTC